MVATKEVAPLVEQAAPVVRQGVQVRRVTSKITELALVREAIREHERGQYRNVFLH